VRVPAPVDPATTTITNATTRLPETHTRKNCFCIRNMII
jgi:hypothetical protein